MKVTNNVKMLKKIYHVVIAFFWKLKRKLRSLVLMTFSRESIFSHYYRANKWGALESKSGEGSCIDETEEVREYIVNIIETYSVKTILDAPCGDFNWMKMVNLDSVHYTGADIVKELITSNSNSYSKNNISFIKLDICKDPLPNNNLMLCRDALVHFSNKDIISFLANIKKSQIKYLLTTTFPETERNIDISTGMWRPINLRGFPFNLPQPILILNEKFPGKNGRYKDKSLALWEVDKI